MFKNLIVYRIAAEWNANAAEIESALDKHRFAPCGPTQQKSLGWVPPRGEPEGALVESLGGHLLLKLMAEQRVVPASAVRQRVEEIVAHIEQTTGRKPGKKETKELKEQALHELLPRAFTRQSATRVWLAPQERLLVIDAGSHSKADEITTLLIKALDGLSLTLVQTAMSPAVAMTHWLGTGEAPYAFTIDRECELKSTDEMKSVVRYARHTLDTDDVRQHITSGKVPTRVAMTWNERVSFVLTDALQLKKLDFLDGVFEDMPEIDKRDKDAVFDSDMAITTGELLELLPDLIEALGGEQVLGAAAAAPVLPTAQETGGTALPQAASVAAAISASDAESVAETEGALESTPPWAD